jgi:hypothetical protein
MATTQTAPEAAHKALEIRKEVFDLDSKGMVTVVKTGDFEPVSTMEEFVSRLGNDAKAILQIVNDGLEKYTEKQLESDTNVPYQLVDEDESGNEVLVPFTGTLLSAEKSASLKATVINFAKLLFGYSKNMVPGDKKANADAKKAAKESALAAILSNPAAVEGLKK